MMLLPLSIQLGSSLGIFVGWYKRGVFARAQSISERKTIPFGSLLLAASLFFLCQFSLRFFSTSALASLAFVKPLLLPLTTVLLFLLARRYSLLGHINFANLKEGIKWTFATRWITILLGWVLSSIALHYLSAPACPQSIVRAIKMAQKRMDFVRAGALIVTTIGIVPILEELFFRGFLQSWLRSLYGARLSICISSLIFALCHFQSSGLASNVVTLPVIFVSSLFIGRIYEKTESLAAPIGMHMANNLIAATLVIFSHIR